MNRASAKGYRGLVVVVGAAMAVAAGLQCGTSGSNGGTAGDAGGGASSNGGNGASSNGGSGASSGTGASARSSTGATSGSSGATATSGRASSTSEGTSSSQRSASSDGGTTDAGALDATAFGPDGACECHPYWCGCGTCDPGQIACTTSPAVCARGCLSSCVEFTQTTCGCDSQGRCVRSGVDAAGIGCLQNVDCPPGRCCVRNSTAQDLTGSCELTPNASCQ